MTSFFVDTDQQRGDLKRGRPNEDCQRQEAVKTASGLRFHLCVVADGGGDGAPDASARLAVDSIFQACATATGQNLEQILLASLAAANKAIYESAHGNDYVGVTAVAIQEGRLFVAQAGRLTRAFLVRSDQTVRAFPLAADPCLGDSQDMPETSSASERFKSGERLVICSDGLFDPPGDDALKADVTSKLEQGLKTIGQYDQLRGAARHLSSIAKGMDVGDDITVMVLGLGPKSGTASGRQWWLAAVVIPAALVVAIVALWPRPPIRPADHGQAVLMSGVVSDGTGAEIPVGESRRPLTDLTIAGDGPAALRLVDVVGEDSTPIAGVNIYIGRASEVGLTTLDLESTAGGKPADPSFLNLTELTLLRGQILVVSEGGRTYVVRIPVGSGDAILKFSLGKQGPGAIAVEIQESSAALYCFHGECEFARPKCDAVTFRSPAKATIARAETTCTPLPAEPLSETDVNFWSQLCAAEPAGSCRLVP